MIDEYWLKSELVEEPWPDNQDMEHEHIPLHVLFYHNIYIQPIIISI